MSLNSTLSPAAVPLTMSSREIAELTGKELGHVNRDIRAMLDSLQDDPELEHVREDQDGRGYTTAFHLGRELTYTLLAGYNVVLRRRVIARWQELEAQQTPKLPQTMAQALRLAAEQAEQIEAQQEQLALAAPKVAFVDRYVAATSGEKGFREVCKLLGANEHEFSEFLARAKIMYRLAGKMTPHAEHLAAGRFKVKTGTAPRNEHAYAQAKFTPKGVEWVAGLWGSHKARLAQEGSAST
ncbi:phage antirepressor KilAC domain-containing protein [Comamonas thiooxydans]|uniref:Phage antirepressor KilAC domain-containing protein n=1 Tax=Comamonas thiooxydans TaxID=363952 RepID=A0AA42TW59_9BURK|nr:phage antirepressor KilAC domain-containing protein [Comamonas thiooxydans]MDH1336810.1 phage antirepressor KilAC domain-containing protein [Comamonas thiooxydans]MDH1742926.1 phage antirepressor KilAC domain-containing protein [Comamonas thiooxydans]MDH1789274.1 phage antirepressor KilAC domain-containing protein [Comamonas thiooxydans]